MWMSRRKMKEKIMQLNYRVADLEERLCPCEDHDWKQTGYSFIGGTGLGDETTLYKHKCRRCGKTKESM